MLTARAKDETIEGVVGVRFRTNAKPNTAGEEQLKEIQYELSGGQIDLPSPTTVPHLNYYYVDVVGGPARSLISLWVPATQESRATELLEAAEFALS